ncbi:MAG: RNA 2',3'-cyclic phosphodiesterase [Methanomassiliicoccaceae archaeon]|jgi:2'-5' RNA ligase|nr:RNA 2',3'-cyclic phosphodiesterase [Methanomassiliicoccaceae archaeon]
MLKRIFIAINFNSDTRSRLLSLRDGIRSNSKRGSFTQPNNIHLTLIFIGESSEAQISLVKAAMDKISFKQFTITMDRTGYFKRGSGSLWWAGVQENDELSALHHDLASRLVSVGFSIEGRRYSPHITLGRDVICNNGPQSTEPFSETVSSIELMISERINEKLKYTAIHTKRAEP